ncbi:MAG: hypothetical protein B6243_05955 [Anaerolineaceae bacterium 4572_5.2]|nr:MAG: hypothetical protein B6243_05955 [Anaerolineaceae bacterium 4572_5.2]
MARGNINQASNSRTKSASPKATLSSAIKSAPGQRSARKSILLRRAARRFFIKQRFGKQATVQRKIER